MGMRIEDGGILTTVQDGGRYGYVQYGVSPSGPMDFRSMHIANILVGNHPGEACLETTFLGPTVCFTEAAVVAVTGGSCDLFLNGRRADMYCAFSVCPGDVLKFGMVKNGCRGYLAVAGGLDIPLLMGSRSTMVGKGFGGYKGRKLKCGDEIGFLKSTAVLPNMPARRAKESVSAEREHVLRVIMGPQDDMFMQEGIDSFLHGIYEVGKEFDRMGCRLEGPLIRHRVDGNIISDGLVKGSVQVPTSGQPIIMLAEAQTVGGYTKIATVITVDFPIIGQCKTGDRIRFRSVSVEQAQELYCSYHQEMRELAEKMTAPVSSYPPRYYTITIEGKVYQVQVEEKVTIE